jgi:hypothetical protein
MGWKRRVGEHVGVCIYYLCLRSYCVVSREKISPEQYTPSPLCSVFLSQFSPVHYPFSILPLPRFNYLALPTVQLTAKVFVYFRFFRLVSMWLHTGKVKCCTRVLQSTHRVATPAFWRTFHHDGKINPGW